MIDALLPFRQGVVDMAEMQARKGLRARQDALADVLERLTLRLADADGVAELLYDVEGAVEHGGAIGVDREIDALAAGEVEHRLLEVLGGGHDHAEGTVFERALLLARRTRGADDAGAGMGSELGTHQPDAAAHGIDQHGVALADATVHRPHHVIGGERLDREGSAGIEPDRIGQLDQPARARDAFLGIGTALLREGRHAIADLDAGDAGTEGCHLSRDLEAQHHGVGHGMRVDADAHLRVGPVAAGIGDIDQYLAGTRHRVGHLGQGELVRPTQRMDHDSFHGASPRGKRGKSCAAKRPLSSRAQRGTLAAAGKVPRYARDDSGVVPTMVRYLAFSTRHTFSGVTGMSMCVMPNSLSASTTAFITDGSAPAQPASPQPFTPKRLVLQGTEWFCTDMSGAS